MARPAKKKAPRKRLDEVERERDEALRMLADAEHRIKELEETQDQVVNRIEWVIDSLHNMKQDTQ